MSCNCAILLHRIQGARNARQLMLDASVPRCSRRFAVVACPSKLAHRNNGHGTDGNTIGAANGCLLTTVTQEDDFGAVKMVELVPLLHTRRAQHSKD